MTTVIMSSTESKIAITVGRITVMVSALFVPLPLFAVSLLVEGPTRMAEGFAAFGWQAGASMSMAALRVV